MKHAPLALVAGFSICLWGTGCSLASRLTGANGVIQSQTPGEATGAGATVIGPSNSAAPTVQNSERRVAYYPPPPRADVSGLADYIHSQTAMTQKDIAPTTVTVVSQPPTTQPLYPAWSYEHTETSIGQHQDAAGLVKAAQVATSWSSIRWLGIFTTIIGIAGYLYSYNNKETGYPLVFVKVSICGIIIALVGSNPWLLLLLVIPVGFYVLQKLNLLKLPL